MTRRLQGDSTHIGADSAETPKPAARAATVVLLRDGSHGVETLMMRRPETISFAGAWVFPGGKIDPADERGAANEHEAARAAGVRETREETGLVVAPAALTPMSVWEPPVGARPQIRTWFFLAAAPEGEVSAQESEVAEWEWLRPEAMLHRHNAGGALLFPPTFVTLARLETVSSVSAITALSAAPVLSFRSRMRPAESGGLFHWGDDDGDDTTAEHQRHRLDTASLPWRYTPGPAPTIAL